MHLVVLGPAGRHDHDRRLDALVAQDLGDVPTVHAGKHEIDHRDVRALVAQLAQSPVSLLGYLDVHAGPAQMCRHRVCDHAVVLGDEHASHVSIVRLTRRLHSTCPAAAEGSRLTGPPGRARIRAWRATTRSRTSTTLCRAIAPSMRRTSRA